MKSWGNFRRFPNYLIDGKKFKKFKRFPFPYTRVESNRRVITCSCLPVAAAVTAADGSGRQRKSTKKEKWGMAIFAI